MNIKAYIDYFSEISEQERSKQFVLLEQAQKLSNQRFHLPIFSLIGLIVPASVLSACIALGFFWLGTMHWSLIIILVAGLLVSRIIVSELNARILHSSLLLVMSNSSSKSAT